MVTLSSSPNSLSALALPPPPTTVKALAEATASATARVPAVKRGSSNTPMGQFQNTVAAPAMISANRSFVIGPMSRPSQLSGRSGPQFVIVPVGSFPGPNTRRRRGQ
jgi:hypothetical protein